MERVLLKEDNVVELVMANGQQELTADNTLRVFVSKIDRTCSGFPSQFDMWDDCGNYYYLRSRSGNTTISFSNKGEEMSHMMGPEWGISGNNDSDNLSLKSFMEKCTAFGLVFDFTKLESFTGDDSDQGFECFYESGVDSKPFVVVRDPNEPIKVKLDPTDISELWVPEQYKFSIEHMLRVPRPCYNAIDMMLLTAQEQQKEPNKNKPRFKRKSIKNKPHYILYGGH